MESEVVEVGWGFCGTWFGAENGCGWRRCGSIRSGVRDVNAFGVFYFGASVCDENEN